MGCSNQWQIQEFGMGEAGFLSPPTRSSPSLLCLLFPSLPSLLSPSFSISPSHLSCLPSLPLEVGPLNPARGMGQRCKLDPQ